MNAINIGMIVAVGFAASVHQASAESAYAVNTSGSLILIDTATPATVVGTVPVSGLQPGDQLVGIDFRPATRTLYALGTTSSVYTINPSTGAASLVNVTTATLTAGSYGFDFNPVVDRIRVVGANGQNLRLDPRNGALAATDGSAAYGPSDVNFGAAPAVVASAYTNNFAGTTSTVLFNIDATTNVLVRQDPPNSGTLTTIGPLGIDATNQTAFDISQGGTPYLVIESTPGVSSSLYTVNLATGAATLVGPVGNASTGVIRSFAVVLPAPNAVRGWGMYE